MERKEKTMKTEKEIESWMRCQGMSGVAVEKIKKLMRQFATPQAFFSARKVDIEAAYRKVSQKNKNGLGNKFWYTFDKVLAFFKTKDDVVDKEEDGKKPEGSDELPPLDLDLIKLISRKEIKAIADMMELLEVESINLIEIVKFLQSVRFRQNCGSPQLENEKNDDAKGGQDGERK